MDRTLYANFPGAITKFRRDTCVKGWDLLGAALVKSDNGGAFAMADIADVTHGPFIEQMNTVAQDLGMTQSEFVDPAGVNDENLSTARDMTMATIASGHHEIIHIPASASQWDAKYKPGQSTKRLYSTNRYSQAEDIEFYTAKPVTRQQHAIVLPPSLQKKRKKTGCNYVGNIQEFTSLE